MTEPTQEKYKALADILGDARGRRVGVSLYGDNLLTAYKAFRLAANLPSEEELKTLVFRHTGDHQYPDYSGAAEAILERIRSVK